MPKLSPISAKKLEKIIFGLGFTLLRNHGSHYFYSHIDGRTTTIPFHGNEDIGVGLLRKILRDINITPQKLDILR